MMKKSKIKNDKKWKVTDNVPEVCPNCGGEVFEEFLGNGNKKLICENCGTLGTIVHTVSNKNIDRIVR